MSDIEIFKRLNDLINEHSALVARVVKLERRQYKLVFFQGTKMDTKTFQFDGGLRDAINEGRRHCEFMGYRFGAVRPSLVDLKHQEKLKATDPEWNEQIDEASHSSNKNKVVEVKSADVKQ